MRGIGNKKKEVVCAFFSAVVAVFFLSYGAYRILHPVPGIKELDWTNPSAPGAILMLFGAVWGVIFLCFIYLVRKG